MKIGKRLIYNTALLTISALVMRSIGLAYQVWLVGKIGSAGIGLFQLVMSVSSLAVVLAISGIRFACTRLVSEEIGTGHTGGVGKAMGRCIAYSLFFGLSASAILYLTAEPIGFLWVGDARTVQPIRLLALSLPFISLSSVFSGYFTAIGRVYKSVAVQIAEQLFRIALVALMLGRVPSGDIEKSCTVIVLAGTAAEVVSFILMLLLYLGDRRKHRTEGVHSKKLTSRMLGVAVPLAVSAYARTSLSTLEHLLVPRGLKSAGFSADEALSGYGTIQGMVFPIIGFPSCFLTALSEMLVPEMTKAQVSGDDKYIADTANSLLEKCLIFSIGVAAILFTFSEDLAMAIYGSAEAGRYIRIFSFITPVMYLDMVTDGMLKGLGQHLYSMKYNILDAALSVGLVYMLLPGYGLIAYIAIICFTECFNFTLSIQRLTQLTRIKLRSSMLLLPLACSIGAAQLLQFISSVAGMDLSASVIRTIAIIAVSALLYSGLIGVVNRQVGVMR